MKILFIGCVDFSYLTLRHLLTIPGVTVVGVITRKESPINSDFHSLEPLAKDNNIPCLCVEGNNQDEMLTWINSHTPDIIYCFGWSYLLRKDVLESAPLGVVGYHPAALPCNRGRHPIIWALALGLKETASTFFFMDEGADSGDILSQKQVTIDYLDDAASVYQKITAVAIEQITEFTQLIRAGLHIRTPQNHAAANYWRKRSKKDGVIDWRMSADNICNLVRALTKPYVGAHCVYNGEEIKIWKVDVLSGIGYQNDEPGKVIRVSGDIITVKCGHGLLDIIKHEFKIIPKEGTYL